jgi:Xaa-Pro dipeptidase
MMPVAPPENLSSHLAALTAADWPRFSDAEMTRRYTAIDGLMAEAGIRHLLVYGAQWNGAAIPWLTHWPTTSEAALTVTPWGTPNLYVQFHNHVPQAVTGATGCAVKWGGEDTIATVIADFQARGATANDRIGVIGPLGLGAAEKLRTAFADVVDLNRAFTRIRLVKSAEEIDWMRLGAWYSDRAMSAVAENLTTGLTERDLCYLCERAWVPVGGETGIHFFGSTSMDDPDCRVPRQIPSAREIAAGDLVFCEISGAFRGYSGQILRSFTVAADPTPLYRDLHDTAMSAFEAICAVLKGGTPVADIVAASGVIENAGFTTCDDLMHGYGGGYLPPVIGSASRPAGQIPDTALEAGMLVVVQPNVTTEDGKAGVQTGDCLLITEDGYERIHAFPPGFHRVG